ncbi:MAG: endonuclease/exonuclease/phosphatase family protein [Alistipes sp.]|nr:endonuclease/exonuclease/phosphatase family protein [Alistipes sp.]
MKTLFLLLSVVLLASSCGNPSETPTPKPPTSKYQKYAKENEIKIMSFNVRTKTSNDTGINHWDERKEACVAVVKDHKPTIIGYQEAQYNSQWVYLKNQLAADYESYGVNRSDGKESGSGEVVGIMWDPKIVKKIEVGTFWLSETPDTPSKGWDARYYRTATWGLFEHLPTGKQFFYINTHLDHESVTAQVEGMKLIANKFKEYQKEVDALFLTGDLNIEAFDKAIDAIKDFMRNARTYANRTDSFGTTNSFESETKKAKIDHIYYSKEMKNPVEYYTIRDTYNGVKFVSDHYPIYTIIRLK